MSVSPPFLVHTLPVRTVMVGAYEIVHVRFETARDVRTERDECVVGVECVV